MQYTSDKRILRLIDLLKFEHKVSSDAEFADGIGILPQTISKIRIGKAHFTPEHIEIICKGFGVNANWIVGIQNNVYTKKNSIELVV